MIANITKEYREEKKLSLKEFSNISKVSASYLHYLESGKCENPSLSILLKLSKAMDISIEELIKK